MESFSDELLEIIEKLKEPVTIIGWSLGASISILTALKKPKNLEKLVLVGFSPKFKDKTLGHNPVAVKAFMLSLRMEFKDTILTFRKTASDKEFREIPIPEKNGALKLLKEFVDLDLKDKLEKIEVPTYLIHGIEDKIINYEGSVFASKKIKNSYLTIVEGNHAPFLEKPEIIINLL